jgi:hypothetical protein
MKQVLTYLLFLTFTLVMGQDYDQNGRAGALQLLVNPFAASSSMNNADVATSEGIEAQFMNVAAIGNSEAKTEILFNRTEWFVGSGISLNAFGVTQQLKERNTIGLSVVQLGMGEIDITTVDNPEGGIGTYQPQFLHLNFAYAYNFSSGISAGLNTKAISESIYNSRAMGIAWDAGVKYASGEEEQFSLGVSLKNIGPKMRYSGDGIRQDVEFSNGNIQTGLIPVNAFDLPLLMNLGVGYSREIKEKHKVTSGFTYQAMAYDTDVLNLGLQYEYQTWARLSVGYGHRRNQRGDGSSVSALTGFSAGVGMSLPYEKQGIVFGIDYTYRDTQPFQGIHTFGARINF